MKSTGLHHGPSRRCSRRWGRARSSVDGERRDLTGLFFVIATENPVEFRGTYPLPEAQMDRFALQFSLGYVQSSEEVAILTAQEQNHPLEELSACASLAEVIELKQAVQQVRVSDELKRYTVDLVGATRTAAGVQLGASPRASIALMKAAQALALFDRLDFVTPEQIPGISGVRHRPSAGHGTAGPVFRADRLGRWWKASSNRYRSRPEKTDPSNHAPG